MTEEPKPHIDNVKEASREAETATSAKRPARALKGVVGAGKAIDLGALPDGATLHSVLAEPVKLDGRKALRVRLTPEAAGGKPNVDFIDMPTFVRLPVDFETGSISVEIKSGLVPDAPDYARGFAGLAYRVSGGSFESVYLRPANGMKLKPPAPRDRRAIQYFAFPDWKFDRLRNEEPDGGFEAGANIATGEWIRLAIFVDGKKLRATVNGDTVLDIVKTKAEPVMGDIGLWVDIGTEAYFADLHVASR